MRSAQLSFCKKKVWIIGSGKQAIKKGLEFEIEGAQVIYIAKEISVDLKDKEYIHKSYEKNDINDGFLVYACTDNKKLNHQIVIDANEKGMLSASVHKDKDATYHPLRFEDYPYLHIAMSTKGSYPFYMDILFKEIDELYENKYHKVLECLSKIRSYLLSLKLSVVDRRSLLKDISEIEYEQLVLLVDIIEIKKVLFLVFHGNSGTDTSYITKNIMAWNTPIPVSYAFLKSEKKGLSLSWWKSMLEKLQIISVFYQPMLLEDGFIMGQLKEQLKIDSILSLLFETEKAIKAILSCYAQKDGLLVLHDSKQKNFYKMIKEYAPSNLHVMMLNESIPDDLPNDIELMLYNGFMLKGKHYYKDVFSKDGIYGMLCKKGYRVSCFDKCILELPVMKDIINKRIAELFK